MDEKLKDICMEYVTDDVTNMKQQYLTIDSNWVLVNRAYLEKLIELSQIDADVKHRKALEKANSTRKTNAYNRVKNIIYDVFDGYTVEEICERRNCSKSTVYNSLHRANKLMFHGLNVSIRKIYSDELELLQQADYKFERYRKLHYDKYGYGCYYKEAMQFVRGEDSTINKRY
jgi:predicted DNA-binding protein YlxM (UPF0122 family)